MWTLRDGDEEEVTYLLERNVAEYGGANCRAAYLTWGSDAAADFLKQQQHDGRRKYDLILASQVSYVPSAIPLLVETMAALLDAQHGEVLLYNDAVSVMASQAECRRILEESLALHRLAAEVLDVHTWSPDLELPHADAYLMRIRHAQ